MALHRHRSTTPVTVQEESHAFSFFIIIQNDLACFEQFFHFQSICLFRNSPPEVAVTSLVTIAHCFQELSSHLRTSSSSTAYVAGFFPSRNFFRKSLPPDDPSPGRGPIFCSMSFLRKSPPIGDPSA